MRKSGGWQSDGLQDRRRKYASGLLIRVIVCVAFGLVLAGHGYFASPEQAGFFSLAVLILVGLALANIPFWLAGRAMNFPLGHFYFHWIIDLLAVTTLLHFLGGIETPYGSVGYMVMIMTSASFLSSRASLIVAGQSTICFGGLVVAEGTGLLPHYGDIWAHDYTVSVQVFMVVASTVFFFLFAYLAGSLAEELRQTNVALGRARDELQVYSRNLEEKVQERTAELQEKNREIQEFIHIVTHDLRNVSVGAAEVARQLVLREGKTLSSRARRYATDVLSDVRDMNRMLGSLLALFRVDNEGDEGERVDLSQLVEGLAKSFRRPAENCAVQWTIHPLPIVHVGADRIRHVYANLIDNAIKYSGKMTKATVEVGWRDESGAPVFYVRDEGIGMESGQLERIFHLYHRGPDQEVDGAKVEGYGVGLAMAKRIIERWGGQIWAESAPGVGTTIFFTIPRQRVEVLSAPAW